VRVVLRARVAGFFCTIAASHLQAISDRFFSGKEICHFSSTLHDYDSMNSHLPHSLPPRPAVLNPNPMESKLRPGVPFSRVGRRREGNLSIEFGQSQSADETDPALKKNGRRFSIARYTMGWQNPIVFPQT
jgi:hypothetical protein